MNVFAGDYLAGLRKVAELLQTLDLAFLLRLVGDNSVTHEISVDDGGYSCASHHHGSLRSVCAVSSCVIIVAI